MRLIASTGGKGGTGKSTFAVLLSLKLSNQGMRILLCDCDVECPNDHLLLGKKLRESEPIYQSFPELDTDKCSRCGTCSKVCRENAILWIKGKIPIFFEDLCNGCGACWIACPQNAIGTKKKVVGETFTTEIKDNLWLVTGMSELGVTETGLVVKEVKKRALKLAEKVGADVLIVDTAPGTHCNVIQALLGCEKAYVVTEPTPLGAHDAGLILKLLDIMEIQSEIVLNKADVGDRRVIEKIAGKYGVPITLEVPYSERLIRAYSEGKLGGVVDLI
ncbi:MAG: hypothetical protein AYL32_013300 [Candidatus Bathyarchaeota archaeon B26-2]|nr:MAG: hypothetical protein AYL32_013300 [Candidatus Bathyarchaeota archaeon B26-2]